MKRHTDAHHCRGGERGGKAKGMEERKNSQEPVARGEVEQLVQLLGVRSKIVVTEHNPFGFAGAAAGKDDGGNVVEHARLSSAKSSFQKGDRCKPSERESQKFLSKPGLGGDFFQQEGPARNFHFDAVEEGLRGEDRLEFALSDTRGQRLRRKSVVEVHR